MKKYRTTTLSIVVAVTVGCLITINSNTDAQNSPKIERTIESRVITHSEKTSEKTAIESTREWVSLGEFKLTAYCGENYPHICNDGDATTTSTGTTPTAGRTIAVNPKQIPYGTKVKIDGIVYTAEDCGGAITSNRIDIFFDTHEEALSFGVKYKEVFVLKEV